MFRKMLVLFLIASIALSACGTLEVDVYQTLTPRPAQSTRAEVTITPAPTQTSTQPATENPAPGPSFSDVSFFTTIGRTPDCGYPSQEVFPAHIRQVYARWNYANMRGGLTIRREWYSNGKLWLQRDTQWDFAKYGADGTIKDISIYDFDAGLEPGNYELRLYINGQPQFDAGPKIDFLVDKAWSLEIASPNGRLTAIIADPQKMMIREADGTKWELVSTHKITSLAWFADSRHIVYSDTDRSNAQGCTSIGIRYRLWIVDATTGEQHQIGTDEENLHRPILSPDQHYIAALTGSGWYDACMVDQGLIFVELDSNLQAIRTFRPQDFTGIPAETSDGSMYPHLENSFSDIGVWQDDTQFKIGLRWTCVAQNNDPSGIYLFDLAGRQVTRTGNLPNP